MKTLGDSYEARAVQLLQEHGLRIVARNFRARTGEIDIVARHGEVLVFVEVRGRSNPGYHGAAASVDRRKQRRLVNTAQVFLQRNQRLAGLPCRFDVLAFEPPQSPGHSPIRWIRGAFTA